MADYADFEIIAELEPMTDRERRIALKCFGSVDDMIVWQDDIVLVYPSYINTHNKLSVHIANYVVTPWFDGLRKSNELIENCPICGKPQYDREGNLISEGEIIPLQNGECMVCGWRAV